MSDLVDRLRKPWDGACKTDGHEIHRLYAMCRDAAAEIERLRVDAERYAKHAESMACALESFELQGSDKTEALRLYRLDAARSAHE